MIKHRLIEAIGSICLALLLVVLSFTVSWAKAPTSSKPIELSFNHLFPEVAWCHTDVVVPWKKMVERRTNGRVKVTIYPACALAKPGNMYDAVKAGTVDICLDPGPYYMGRFPMSEATHLPFILGSKSCLDGSLQGISRTEKRVFRCSSPLVVFSGTWSDFLAKTSPHHGRYEGPNSESSGGIR